ncbi:antibiotic biosynthesis monooxygenase [Pseudomonas cichorii]|uniref:antibiotic biosynthesis monooxygenase n=1 Tax=Pseudomonas cichorii TaxID=36746 RepID=UPI000EFEBFD9|nr:antibiotic biosynthesis monooxygenase [Pseudomonas cichorii]
MSKSSGEHGFGQTLEMLVSPLSVQALVKALTKHTEQFTCQHPGFVGARVQINEYQNAVQLHLYWLSKEAGEHALAYPKQNEPDLVQIAHSFQVHTMIFQTFFVCAQV